MPHPRPPAAGALVGSGPLLTNTFLLSFVYFGAAPIAWWTVLLLLPLALVAFPRQRAPAWRGGCDRGAVPPGAAHLWQALVVAPACAVLVLPRPRSL